MYYVLRTISYFLTWGVLYGLLLGGLTGTALIPLAGTFFGILFGAMGGLIGGGIAGLAAIAFGAAHIDIDTNLDLHRRQVAWQIGASVVLIPLLVWVTGSFLIRGFIELGLVLPLALPWAGLAAAHVAHHYHDVIVKDMTKGKRGLLEDYEEDLHPQLSIQDAWAILWQTGSRKLRMLIGAGGLALIHLSVIMSPRVIQFPLASGLEILLAAVLGAFLSEVIWIYIALSNSLLLTFIKKLILHDYYPQMSPVRYQRILTGTTFFFTLLITWWTLILAPVLATMTAYHVYRTLALPDETIDKAKRKEKNALALQDNINEEDEMLLVEEERLTKAHQR